MMDEMMLAAEMELGTRTSRNESKAGAKATVIATTTVALMVT
jgi:hypothetical protein